MINVLKKVASISCASTLVFAGNCFSMEKTKSTSAWSFEELNKEIKQIDGYVREFEGLVKKQQEGAIDKDRMLAIQWIVKVRLQLIDRQMDRKLNNYENEMPTEHWVKSLKKLATKAMTRSEQVLNQQLEEMSGDQKIKEANDILRKLQGRFFHYLTRLEEAENYL